MSQKKPPKKKVVVSTSKTTKNTAAATPRRTRRSSAATPAKQTLVLGRQNYILMGVGAALIFLGLLLMSGGHMPSSDVWDDNIIYSFRRITLAPIVILAGIVVEVIAIFKK